MATLLVHVPILIPHTCRCTADNLAVSGFLDVAGLFAAAAATPDAHDLIDSFIPLVTGVPHVSSSLPYYLKGTVA